METSSYTQSTSPCLYHKETNNLFRSVNMDCRIESEIKWVVLAVVYNQRDCGCMVLTLFNFEEWYAHENAVCLRVVTCKYGTWNT